MKLTARQQEILNYIGEFRRQAGCSPSIPELQRAFGFRSPNAVSSHLAALESKGAIRRAERGSRQIEIPGEGRRGVAIPLLGAIAAGNPQQQEPVRPEECLHVDLEALGFRPQRGCFALRVRGESMKDAAIVDGDIVVVQPSPGPKAGQIVAALIDGESTLKRLVFVRGRWYLKAENAAYPELIPRSDLVIQGVVQLVIRQLKA